MQIVEKPGDLTEKEREYIQQKKYVCIDTETTGLNYLKDKLCTIQLYCEPLAIIIRFDENNEYSNLKQILYSDTIVKIFHNAVFDVSFLMKNLNMDIFGQLVCTKIASKIINGIEHNNSLQALLWEYLDIKIDKTERLSDWTKKGLSNKQKDYAIGDVRYLYPLWMRLKIELNQKNLDHIAQSCFDFVPWYKQVTDMGIENIFRY